MFRHATISQQLLWGLILPLCTLLAISAIVAYSLADWFANDAYDQELLNAAHAVAGRLREDDNGLVAELPGAVQAVLRHNDRDKFYYQVLSNKNIRLAGDAILPMPTRSTDLHVPRFRDATVDGDPVRVARIKVPLPDQEGKPVIVQVARTINTRRELSSKIFLSIVIPQLVLGILCIVTLRAGIRRGLQPLRQLSEAIKTRSQLELTPIDYEHAPGEVIPIVQALNSLLIRLDTYVSAQQRFVANAAHQLRTPVAGLKAYIAYGKRFNRDPKIDELLGQLETGSDRISELVAGLLILARAGDAKTYHMESVDLNFVVSEVTSMLVRQAADKQIELIFYPAQNQAVVEGDKMELREMISNIVVNAIRYTQVGGTINVTIQPGPPVTVVITDNGPGIPVAERERVFERFYRVLGTKVNGSGLGLAIVNEIARAHNAQVELDEPASGQGTLVRVKFAA